MTPAFIAYRLVFARLASPGPDVPARASRGADRLKLNRTSPIYTALLAHRDLQTPSIEIGVNSLGVIRG